MITLDLPPGWFQRAVDEALSKPSACECKKALMTLNDEMTEKYREKDESRKADSH